MHLNSNLKKFIEPEIYDLMLQTFIHAFKKIEEQCLEVLESFSGLKNN